MRKLTESIHWTRGLEDLVVWVLAAEIGRVNGDFLWRGGRCLQACVLLLDFASTFDEHADEGLCVAVDRCDDVWRDRLGDGLVGDLDWMSGNAECNDNCRVEGHMPFGPSLFSVLLGVDTHSVYLDRHQMRR